jgi:hypothetical protein
MEDLSHLSLKLRKWGECETTCEGALACEKHVKFLILCMQDSTGQTMDTRFDCCWALCNLIVSNNNNAQKVIDLGAVEALADVIKECSERLDERVQEEGILARKWAEELQSTSIRALALLNDCDLGVKNQIRSSGVLEHLYSRYRNLQMSCDVLKQYSFLLLQYSTAIRHLSSHSMTPVLNVVLDILEHNIQDYDVLANLVQLLERLISRPDGYYVGLFLRRDILSTLVHVINFGLDELEQFPSQSNSSTKAVISSALAVICSFSGAATELYCATGPIEAGVLQLFLRILNNVTSFVEFGKICLETILNVVRLDISVYVLRLVIKSGFMKCMCRVALECEPSYEIYLAIINILHFVFVELGCNFKEEKRQTMNEPLANVIINFLLVHEKKCSIMEIEDCFLVLHKAREGFGEELKQQIFQNPLVLDDLDELSCDSSRLSRRRAFEFLKSFSACDLVSVVIPLKVFVLRKAMSAGKITKLSFGLTGSLNQAIDLIYSFDEHFQEVQCTAREKGLSLPTLLHE